MPAGRPSNYDPKRTPEVARGLANLDHTDDNIASLMGIDRATLYRWKEDHPELCDALKKGKEHADKEVESALLKRALGYSYEETTVIGRPGKDGKLVPQEVKKSTKQSRPNVTACIFWLKNRRPDLWRDVNRGEFKIEHVGYTETSDAELVKILEHLSNGKKPPRKPKAKAKAKSKAKKGRA